MMDNNINDDNSSFEGKEIINKKTISIIIIIIIIKLFI